MGLNFVCSSDSYPSDKYAYKEVPIDALPNPNPSNYKIIDTLTVGNFLIVEIVYPDCKNYEGKKILVYEGVTWQQLRSQKLIDPHFSNKPGYFSPIARFEPTKRGFVLAERFARACMK